MKLSLRRQQLQITSLTQLSCPTNHRLRVHVPGYYLCCWILFVASEEILLIELWQSLSGAGRNLMILGGRKLGNEDATMYCRKGGLSSPEVGVGENLTEGTLRKTQIGTFWAYCGLTRTGTAWRQLFSRLPFKPTVGCRLRLILIKVANIRAGRGGKTFDSKFYPKLVV